MRQQHTGDTGYGDPAHAPFHAGAAPIPGPAPPPPQEGSPKNWQQETRSPPCNNWQQPPDEEHEENFPPLPPFRSARGLFNAETCPPAENVEEKPSTLTAQEKKEKRKQMKAHTEAQIKAAKRNANLFMPPPDVPLFASALTMGQHLGVGMGLYFQLLEWLMIMFACITFLAIPYWIVINQSVFTNEQHKDEPGVGVQKFEEASMLSTTFASIVGHQLDPNNTLTYMNTKLGQTWYGPQKKNDFLLWVSLLDVVAVVLMIFLLTFFTWKSRWFELEVDKHTYDVTDYAVLVTGLPPDAGFHEVGHFFSRFGEVMDVTLMLDMEVVLKACAKASKLEQKRELQAHYMRMLPLDCRAAAKKQLDEIEDQLIKLLVDINETMDKQIVQNKQQQEQGLMHKNRFLGLKHNKVHDDTSDSPEGYMSKIKLDNAGLGYVEQDAIMQQKLGADPKGAAAGSGKGLLNTPFPGAKFMRHTVYPTKAAFVTFNRTSDQRECLKLTPNPGFQGWLYSHTVAKDAQCMRGFCIETTRASGPSDYIFENMVLSKQRRFWRRFLIRILYLVMLIVCAIIVSALSSQTRVDLDRTALNLNLEEMRSDVGQAASLLPTGAPSNSTIADLRDLYEQALSQASSASEANFTDYCSLALPGVCAPHYRQSLGGTNESIGLQMTFREHFEWGSFFDQAVYERPLLNSLTELAGAEDPQQEEGANKGLSACLACYCIGLLQEDESEEQTGVWLALSNKHCNPYDTTAKVDAGTETGISIVIVVLNVVLKLFVQILAAHEMQWTRSAMERSFCVVAYLSQLLNSVLVVLLVNARPNARTTETGERVDAQDIGGLKYIILGGSFDDFSSAWYEYVGQSFMVLLFIQLIIPFVNILLEYIFKWVSRGIVRCNSDSTQADFNSAYNYPQFLLQQRVADVMLNISVALLFCSGMPLCAAVVIVVFAITNIVDRWAVVSLMTVTRYTSELPRLILGLLPFAVFFHACFGLWMHSHFMHMDPDSDSTAVFIQMGREDSQNKVSNSNQFGQYIDTRTVESRISQPNAFGLLLLAFIMFLWMVYRFIIAAWVKPLVLQWLSGKDQEALDNPSSGANKTLHYRFLKWVMSAPKLHIPGMPDAPDDDDEVTFEEALTQEKLQGLPTFRLPFHPRYAPAFSGLLHGAIWFKMLGPYRFTRLIPAKEEELLNVYRVTVRTSDIKGAGTDSDVLITISGELNGKPQSTQQQELSSMSNNFEQGCTDRFSLTTRDVGKLTRVQVRSCSRGFNAKWHLESILITDTLRGISYFFPCNTWLDPRHPKSLLQTLYPKSAADVAHPKKAISLDTGPGSDGMGETVVDFVDATAAAREVEEMQRRRKLSRVRLVWHVSPHLILDAGKADLESNIAEMRERGMGGRLAKFAAKMAVRPKVPHASKQGIAEAVSREPPRLSAAPSIRASEAAVQPLDVQHAAPQPPSQGPHPPPPLPLPLPLQMHRAWQLRQQQQQQLTLPGSTKPEPIPPPPPPQPRLDLPVLYRQMTEDEVNQGQGQPRGQPVLLPPLERGRQHRLAPLPQQQHALPSYPGTPSPLHHHHQHHHQQQPLGYLSPPQQSSWAPPLQPALQGPALPSFPGTPLQQQQQQQQSPPFQAAQGGPSTQQIMDARHPPLQPRHPAVLPQDQTQPPPPGPPNL